MPDSDIRRWLGALWTRVDQRRSRVSQEKRRRKRHSKLGVESLDPRYLLTAVPGLLSDLTGDAASSFPKEFVQSGSNAFFVAGGTELWKTDGTSGGTMLLKDFDNASGNAQLVTDLTDVNGTLALGFVDFGTTFFPPGPGSEVQLWKSDGTVGGTELVEDFGTGSFSGSPSEGAYLTNVNGTLFASISTQSFGAELWKSNLQSFGTTMVKDINSGSGGSEATGLLSFNGKLFFSADDGTNGTELWTSDGTSGGTMLVKDIKPGSWTAGPYSGYPRGSFPSDLTPVNGHFFFGAIDAGADDDPTTPADNKIELWKSDGTSGGTVLVKDFGGGSSSYDPALTNLNGTLFGVVNVPSSGTELWKSDGTSGGTQLVRDIVPGTSSSYPHNLVAAGDTLFFGARDGSRGTELWKSDGTSGGTVIVKDIRPTTCCAPYEGFYGALTNVNGSVFFQANDGSSGKELWQSDGTLAGTVLVSDINPGATDSSPYYLANINGTLYFSANDGSGGTEPWLADEASLDFGDAPDPTFPTLQANDGARHALGSGLFLGSGVDVDTDGQPNATATGDDTVDGNDDEDGLTPSSTLVPGQTATFAIESSGAGFVDGWIDINGDGMWTHPDEHFLESVPVAAGSNDFAELVPANSPFGPTFIRIRLSSAGGLLPTGLASDGEVEDYQVLIETVNRFVVNSVGDAVDANLGDNLCETATPGECTLRAAIQQANSTANLAAGPDVIIFDVPGAGPHTISPTSALPSITQPVVIDGTTEPDFGGTTPVVELAGTSAGAASGLTISAGNSTVRGLAINRFAANGILLATGGGNTIQQNMIGTNPAGTADLGNGTHGVNIFNSPNNLVGSLFTDEGNVISGNGLHGVFITRSSSTGNDVKSNILGLGLNGVTPIGNSGAGVRIDQGANGNNIGGSGNVISGNTAGGVVIDGGSTTNNTIAGNRIGTDITGLIDRGNLGAGVTVLSAPGNKIGVPGDGNLISGNNADGVFISGASAASNLVQGNRIGVDDTGNAALQNNQSGVTVNGAPNNTIGGTAPGAGNVLSGNNKNGVFVVGGGASGNKLEGNLIGTNAAGSAPVPNVLFGIVIRDAPTNTVGGTAAGAANVISGNTQDGVAILLPLATGNVVAGNMIGTDSTGTADVGNSKSGVLVWQAPSNTIGGTTAASRNIISGNDLYGVRISTPAASNSIVQGNYIGTDITGTTALPNSNAGVQLANTQNAMIGGAAAGAGNVISGNGNQGVLLTGAGVANNNVQGNIIGLDVTGTVAMGNTSGGVRISAGAHDNTIGGDSTAGEGNVISGNGFDGVLLVNVGTRDNTVSGNSIGTDITGTTALGNTRHGVFIIDGETNTIGGTMAGAGNVISGNVQSGVVVFGNSTGNAIERNSMFSNGALGIDLGLDGVTVNDTTGGSEDVDTGPNNLQNFPVISLATLSGTDLDVTYSVPANTAHSAYPLSLEFFLADAAGQEGQTFLGTQSYTAAVALGSAAVSIDVTGKGVSVGGKIVGTATDSAGNTSEFSAPVTVSVPLLAAAKPILSAEACRAYRGDSAINEDDLEILRAGLQPIVDAGILRWQQMGIDANQLSHLHAIDVSFAELDGAYLALTTANTIRLDANAAGFGWYIDSTPLDDSEFRGQPSASSDQQSMDLLTVVMHEMGHVLGLDDVWEDSLAEDIMFARLQAGHRRLG